MKYKKHFQHYERPIKRPYIPSTLDVTFVNEQVTIDGLVTTKQKKQVIDRAKTYEAFLAPDFSLQNQLAVGVVARKPLTLSSDNIDADIAAVERLNMYINAATTKPTNSQTSTEE